jgi:hypothetical protein
MRYVMKHYDRIHERVRAMMRYIDEQAGISAAERFWSALIASTLVAMTISKKLGITSWSAEAALQWVVKEQIPSMRNRVVEEYVDPVNCLMNYLTEIHGATIMVDSDKPDILQDKREVDAGRGRVAVIAPFHSHTMFAQYDASTGMIWMAHRPFRSYCQKIGCSWQDVVDALKKEEIIVGRARRVLGANTVYAKAAVDAHLIDASHAAISNNVIPAWTEKTANPAPNVVPLRGKRSA